MTQFKHIGYDDSNLGEMICLKCLQNTILDTGILYEEGYTFEELCYYAMFYSISDLKNNNWEHFQDYHNKPEGIIETIKNISKDFYFLIDLYSMAIGGVEAYWSLYTKSKKNDDSRG
jgi:hypothetical protein